MILLMGSEVKSWWSYLLTLDQRLKCAFIVTKVCRMNRIFKKYLLIQCDFLNNLAFGVIIKLLTENLHELYTFIEVW